MQPALKVASGSIAALVTIGLVLLGLTPAAKAQAVVKAQTAEIVSTYTSTAKKDCKAVGTNDPDDDGFVHVCPGMGNLIVLNTEGDLREAISVGRTRAAAEKEPAAQRWFGPFSSTTNTIEWRHPKGGAPFAIIQRWHLADNEDPDANNRPRTKQLLVVTRLPPGPVCQIALIDVKANADANEIARRAANEARTFDCAKDQIRIGGLSGRAVELARPR
jgi:hypothetical protein